MTDHLPPLAGAGDLPTETAEADVPGLAPIHNQIQQLVESPLTARAEALIGQSIVRELKPDALVILAADIADLQKAVEADPKAVVLRGVVRLTYAFVIARQGSNVAMQTQGEWRMTLAEMEQEGGWQGMLAAWNAGKLDALLAGQLPPEHQLALLRQSSDSFQRAWKAGTHPMPMAVPVPGADIDGSIHQTEQQRGTPLVSTTPVPLRVHAAMAVTVAYAEKEAGNTDEMERRLAMADEAQIAAKLVYEKAPFLRLNMEISAHIAAGAIREAGNADTLQAYIKELADSPAVSPHKKTEWLAHAYALLALATSDEAHVETTFTYLEALAAARPTFMTIIAIEPTFKELAKRFPNSVPERLQALYDMKG